MASLGYARVSTDGQTLDAQVAELKAAGAERIFQEKISGVVTERIQLRRAMKALSPDDVLIVTRLDRLARSTRDLPNTLATVGEIGAGFRSLRDTWADTTTPHGRLMLTILAGLAEFERELIKSRTSEGRERAKSRGVRMGRRPKLTAHQRQEALARREAGEKCRTGVNPDEIVAYYTGGREALEARRAAAKAPARSSTWEKEKSQYSAHLSSNNRQATKTDYEKKLRLPELSRFRSVPSITANEIAKAYADIHARSRSTGHAFRRVVKAFWTYLGDATRADETGVTIDLSRLKKIPDPPAEIGDPNTPFNPEDEQGDAPPEIELGRLLAISRCPGVLDPRVAFGIQLPLASAQRRRTVIGAARNRFKRYRDSSALVSYALHPYRQPIADRIQLRRGEMTA